LSISVAPLVSFGSKLILNAAELPKFDAEFEEITEGEELTKKERRAAWDAARQTERSAARRVQEQMGGDCINRKTKWAALEERFFTIAPALDSRPGKAKKFVAVALV
jgi:hypothetical protein